MTADSEVSAIYSTLKLNVSRNSIAVSPLGRTASISGMATTGSTWEPRPSNKALHPADVPVGTYTLEL